MLHRGVFVPAGLLIAFFLFFCGSNAGFVLYVREGCVGVRGGEERGRAGRGISGRRLVEVRDRVGGKGSRRRGSVIQGVWGQSSPSCLTRAGLSRGAGQRDAATFTLPYVFVSPPSGCSILSSLSLPRRGGGVRAGVGCGVSALVCLQP